MKLFYSPFHTFIHKVLVTAHEAGLWDDITFVPTYPFKNRDGEDQGDAYSIAALNPLDKVPTLALDSGQVVYGSQAVVECLDSMSKSGNHLYPPVGPGRCLEARFRVEWIALGCLENQIGDVSSLKKTP